MDNLEKVNALLELGFYVICKVSVYIGNGEFRRQKYKYKVYSPIFSVTLTGEKGQAFTTDIFASIGRASVAAFGLYLGTQPRIDAIMRVLTPEQIDFKVTNPEFYKTYNPPEPTATDAVVKAYDKANPE